MIKFIKAITKKYFLSGIIIITPVFITLWIFIYIVLFLDQIVKPFLTLFLPEIKPFNFEIHGYGIILTFFVILLVGAVGKNIFGQYFIKESEKLLQKLPILPKIYSTIKQIIKTLFGKDKTPYSGVAIIEYPRKGLYTIALITGEPHSIIKDKLEKDAWVSLFVPTTPNPTSGFYLVAKESEIKRIDISVEDALKLVISCGIIKEL